MSDSSTPRLPSEQRFGLTMAAACLVLGIYGIIRHRSWTANGAFLLAGVLFGLAACVVPKILAPLNKAWFHLGKLLGKVTSPIALGIIFFGILTPIAAVIRLFGRDELRLKRRREASYWIDRTPPGSWADSFKNQF